MSSYLAQSFSPSHPNPHLPQSSPISGKIFWSNFYKTQSISFIPVELTPPSASGSYKNTEGMPTARSGGTVVEPPNFTLGISLQHTAMAWLTVTEFLAWAVKKGTTLKCKLI